MTVYIVFFMTLTLLGSPLATVCQRGSQQCDSGGNSRNAQCIGSMTGQPYQVSVIAQVTLYCVNVIGLPVLVVYMSNMYI